MPGTRARQDRDTPLAGWRKLWGLGEHGRLYPRILGTAAAWMATLTARRSGDHGIEKDANNSGADSGKQQKHGRRARVPVFDFLDFVMVEKWKDKFLQVNSADWPKSGRAGSLFVITWSI